VDRVAKEAERLAQLIGGVSKAMGEQANAAGQITGAVDGMRRQSEQMAKAMMEQARATKDMTGVTQNVAKRIAMVTRSNQEHLAASSAIAGNLVELRAVTDRNAGSMKEAKQVVGSLQDSCKNLLDLVERR
jgi:methyl-accepting chemotaxis protein